MKLVLIYIAFVLGMVTVVWLATNNQTSTFITPEEKSFVETRVTEEFSKKWDGWMDGCSLEQVLEVRKVGSKYTANIQYGCGMVRPGYVSPTKWVNVSGSGKVTGLP
jgi:hypothetical protein